MPLDPIVSLSVAIAEAPGSYAVLLGAGVSRDAGVPTGEQVFWNGVGELYRLENETEETPDQEALETWLQEQGRGDLDYSSLLELAAPDPAIRREYLAKHFEGREPGAAHERLAALAEAGYVRVFVTTNFDRLLERALLARGIEPIVITSAAELAQAPRREHAACYVLKPHGDYLQETIRNTRGELSNLGAQIEAELAEVFDRFGLLVLGYAGNDEAIIKAISIPARRRCRAGRISSLEQLDAVNERWPELLEGDEEPAKSADEFDFLVTLSCGLNPGRPPLAHWSMRDLGAVPLARRLRADDVFRARVAKALQLEPEEFFDRAREALERHQRPSNTFADSNAISVLLGNNEDLP